MWESHDGWGWGMLFGGLMMVLFWGGMLLAIYWIVKAAGTSSDRGSFTAQRRESAEEIVDRRLAAGEIDEGEYVRIVARLSRGGATS